MFGGKNKKEKQKRVCLECSSGFFPNRPSDHKVYCSKKCRHYGLSKRRSGCNSPTWRGGLSRKSKNIRAMKQYQDWRKEVLERDKYTCRQCGSKENLEVDHSLPLYLFKELVIDKDNGRTLCKDCHKKKTALDKWFKKKFIDRFIYEAVNYQPYVNTSEPAKL